MKIEIPKQTDQASIGNFESMEAGIDKSSLPFVLEMLSKNFYSNPIGSTVREITSNCFDSHSEANVDEPVIVEISGTDERFVSFKDSGVGLSTDRIKNIYLKYFSSTKRETDDQIGGFGLGSKSPLSYTDYFYINTVFDGVRYEYIFSKGDTLPTLDLLITENTTERNGTEIKIPILKEDDEDRFIQEMKDQLSYFDNVYFIGCGIDNEYKIYEGNYFKYRNKDQYSDEMHICFGKVAYPIDWKQLKRDSLEIPIAIKFDIGDLVVTPNREALRYTEKVIVLVNERIDKTLEELKGLYEGQKESHDDFRRWWINKRESKSILLGEDRLKSPEFKKFKRNSIFTPFESLGIEDFKMDDPIKHLYSLDKSIKNTKVVEDYFYSSSRSFTDFFLDYTPLLCYSKDTNFSAIKNFNNKNCRILTKRKIKSIVDDLLHYKKWSYGFATSSLTTYQIDRLHLTNSPYHFVKCRKDEKGKDIDNDHYFNLGLSIRLYKFIKYLKTLVENEVKDYHRVVSTQVILEYEAIRLENDGNLRRKLEEKIFVNILSQGTKDEWSIYSIDNFNGIIVYGYQDDQKALERAIKFLHLRPTLRDKSSDKLLNSRACKVIKISKQNSKYFKNKPNMVYVKDLYSDNKLFRQLASTYKIEDLLKDLLKNYSGRNTEAFLQFFRQVNSDIADKLSDLQKYYKEFTTEDTYYCSGTERADLKKTILQVAYQNNLFDPCIESQIKIIEDYFKGVEILKHIDFNNETLPAILMYLREKKKRINFDYYTKLVPPTQAGDQLSIDFEPIQQETKFKIITEAA